MKNSNFEEIDVVIIQKQTTLERYTKQTLNIDFYDYLIQDNQGKEILNLAHNTHLESRKTLLQLLKQLNMTYAIFNLDELKQNNFNFFDENNPRSGLNPKQKLVISLGGDGTLLHASHYVGGAVKLLGINSCPKNSVGHLCFTVPEDIVQILEEILLHKKYHLQTVKRLRVNLSNNRRPPLALNDVLLSHLHPAATSRYQISILNKKSEVMQIEKQLSSGLWISTAAGSTAAIASYGFPPEPLNSSKILGACREPYSPNGSELRLEKFTLDGKNQSLSIFSRMRQGLVCLDGPDFSAQFGFGETIEISSPESASLLLIK